MTDELDPDDRERLIRAKQEQLQQILEEYKATRTDPTEGFGFDPGGDPIMQEAVLRLMQDEVRKQLAAHGVVDDDELSRTMAELREQVVSSFNRPEE